MHVVLLLVAVATAAVVAAAETAAVALRRRGERLQAVERRVAAVVDATASYYRANLSLPATLGALVGGGYLDPDDTFDPFVPTASLRLRRRQVRGTLTVWSRGGNHVDERGAGDDVSCSVTGVLLGTQLTHDLGRQFARAVASRVGSSRSASDLDAGNAARYAILASERTWLESNATAADWPRRLVEHLAAAARTLPAASAASGRGTAALDQASAAVAADADGVAATLQGAVVARGALTAADVRGLGLPRAAARSLRAGLLQIDDVQRAHRSGVLAVAAWRSRASDRLAGLHARLVAALLEAQDGDSGLQHPLAGSAGIDAAVAALGLPAEARTDGFARAWRLEPAPGYGVRSRGPDRRAGTADDRVYAAW
ncbi:MAG: hypothetical protein R3F56_06765 [Planctomycetota bacterium]